MMPITGFPFPHSAVNAVGEGQQCGHDFLMGQIAQAQPAALAFRILEIQRLSAILALEKLHGPIRDSACDGEYDLSAADTSTTPFRHKAST